jgi:multiple sugar transport system ATP-binding protein
MNLVEADVRSDGTVAFAEHVLALPAGSPLRALAGRRVILGIRPSAFELDGPRASPDWPAMHVACGLVEHLGDEMHASFHVDAPRVTADAVVAAADEGDDGDARLLADDERARFTAVLGGRVRVLAGDEVTLRVDHTQLHAFDPATGASLTADAGGAAGGAAAASESYTNSTSTPSAASA